MFLHTPVPLPRPFPLPSLPSSTSSLLYLTPSPVSSRVTSSRKPSLVLQGGRNPRLLDAALTSTVATANGGYWFRRLLPLPLSSIKSTSKSYRFCFQNVSLTYPLCPILLGWFLFLFWPLLRCEEVPRPGLSSNHRRENIGSLTR